MGTDLIGEAVALLRVGDAVGARAAYQRAASELGPTGEVLEGLASASFVLLEFPRSLEEMESAYAAYSRAGDTAAAARVARMLGGMHGSTTGQWAVASGWIARAKTLLSEHPTSVERGWVALTEGMFSTNRQEKNLAFETALAVGRGSGDAELTFATLAYLGASLVHADLVDEGMVLLDEALAAVVGGEVDNFMIIEEIFCQMFSACEHAQDVDRAEQWIRVGEQVARRRSLPAVSAYCRTHYGGILTAAGRWPEADQALTEAVRLWESGRRTLKSGALVRLADLRVRQGRFEEAERLLEGQTDADATRPRAALHLARGESPLALDLLEHALHRAEPGSSACIPLLGLLVEAQVTCGEDSRQAVEELEACAQAHPSPYAKGMAARGRSRAEDGDTILLLREALDWFAEASLPWEASLCRLDLARALRTTHPQVAVAEARRALATFEALRAAPYVDTTTALLRQLGQKVASPPASGQTLTRREAEVLQMLGEGLSNPEISERLFISRKTVEHHVGNVLAKLGLRNRAEATAYAVRHQRPGERAPK